MVLEDFARVIVDRVLDQRMTGPRYCFDETYDTKQHLFFFRSHYNTTVRGVAQEDVSGIWIDPLLLPAECHLYRTLFSTPPFCVCVCACITFADGILCHGETFFIARNRLRQKEVAKY